LNKLKEKKVVEVEQPEEQPVKKSSGGGNKLFRYVSSVFSGTFLTREQNTRQLPFFLFLALLAICYITNGNYAEKKIRSLNKVNDDLKELRSEFIISKSNLMFISKQSEVAKATLALGIKESVVPPKKIVVKKQIREKEKD
jgi:hypothetical protein